VAIVCAPVTRHRAGNMAACRPMHLASFCENTECLHSPWVRFEKTTNQCPAVDWFVKKINDAIEVADRQLAAAAISRSPRQPMRIPSREIVPRHRQPFLGGAACRRARTALSVGPVRAAWVSLIVK